MHPCATTTALARHSQWHSRKGSSSPPTVNPVTRFSPHTPVTGEFVKTFTIPGAAFVGSAVFPAGNRAASLSAR